MEAKALATADLVRDSRPIRTQIEFVDVAMSARVTSGRTTAVFDREISMVKVSVFYLNRPGSHFDMSYYCSKHIYSNGSATAWLNS